MAKREGNALTDAQLRAWLRLIVWAAKRCCTLDSASTLTHTAKAARAA